MFRFIHYDLGPRLGGEIVHVSLCGAPANVLLLDDANYQSYRTGRRYECVGGRATTSSVRLEVPSCGDWHAVVDMRGLRGRTRASFQVIDPSAP
jgi:hypothetical protein